MEYKGPAEGEEPPSLSAFAKIGTIVSLHVLAISPDHYFSLCLAVSVSLVE